MKEVLNKYWNFKLLGFPHFFFTFVTVTALSLYERFFSVLWRYNLGKAGGKIFIQSFTKIRYPGNVSLGNKVSIGRKCMISSDFSDSKFTIDSNSQINRDCIIDYSGGLNIGKNVVISEKVNIMTHSHGYDPHSIPSKFPLKIEDNVWIGSNSIILPKVSIIGFGSIIASGSIVTKDVPQKVIVGGNPAKIISKINI